MLSRIWSVGLVGIDGYMIEVETDINLGMPSYELVGLADTAIKESRERVRSAIKNSGMKVPIHRITINLAPADVKKEGSLYDLPIAIGILTASEQISFQRASEFVMLGELSLNGDVKPVNGILPLLISARSRGYKKFIIPAANAKEASYIEGIESYPVASLRSVAAFLKGVEKIEPVTTTAYSVAENRDYYESDFAFVKGQKTAKRAVEIAVCGGHNLLMIGPPGAGKTMIAKCVPSIMPDMSFEEALEVTKIHSIAGLLDKDDGIVKTRPFRTPHHTATRPALIGGGATSRPGEISLAHNGVLFLDEMPEYTRATLETLRQPLEDRKITVSRAAQSIEYPASFMLVASMNPCPCGNFGSSENECRCTHSQILNYVSKLSGPLLDRIDIQVEVDSVKYIDLVSETPEEPSRAIKERVDIARAIQRERLIEDGMSCNADMGERQLKKFCALSRESDNILRAAFEKLKLSARARSRIIKVARTIADLDGKEKIAPEHIAEAIQYRMLDRKYWS